ncbi:5-methylcytosine restriction system specificity protein McrC [Halorubrum sp. AS12]|uniref:5-methylcytosine restriction system specificity protein McrC n=1 Tax=Halorubrum sp. AS12 TaxID=3409687 RepID=UPI003DA761F2
MNDIFESVVVEAVRQIYAGSGVEVVPQARRQELFYSGSRSVPIKPDVAVIDDEETVFVGDAKWKVDRKGSRSPSSGDLSQMIGYQVAYDGTGILFYPEQDGWVESVYESDLEHDLQVVELPTQSTGENDYSSRVIDKIRSVIQTTPE